MPLSNFQPENYAALLANKTEALLPRFSKHTELTPTITASPPREFRLRAEFRVWHSGDDINYVMFRSDAPKTPVVITDFPIAATSIRELMPRLLAALAPQPTLRRKLFQIEFLSTLSGDMLVTLIYHRPLDDDWQASAEQLSESLDISIVGRSRKQKRIIRQDWVTESLLVAGREYQYRQPEQAFTQPNGIVNQHMIEWALDSARTCGGDLLELYCGIGNFTLPLAQAFDQVIATELSKPATAAADLNRQANAVGNVTFARLSAEDMSSALAGDRAFRRLAHLHKPLNAFRLNTLLVDPPRAGLDPQTLRMAARFDNIIYISCNPDTLLSNLETLGESHRIERFGLFDQFPYTHHMESGVLLRRRS